MKIRSAALALAGLGMVAGCASGPSPELVQARKSMESLKSDKESLSNDLATYQGREDELDQRKQQLDKRKQQLDKRAEDLDKREKRIKQAEADVKKNTIPGSGTFLVGEDIDPGQYYTDGPSGSSCYWARLSGTSGDFGDTITNGNISGPTTVTIEESDDAFTTKRCQDWQKR